MGKTANKPILPQVADLLVQEGEMDTYGEQCAQFVFWDVSRDVLLWLLWRACMHGVGWAGAPACMTVGGVLEGAVEGNEGMQAQLLERVILHLPP